MERKEKHFVVTIATTSGRGIVHTELARTQPAVDAANKYIADPVYEVMRRAADKLEALDADSILKPSKILFIKVQELPKEPAYEIS